ncbi:MAG: hypothetical protein R3E79_48950 [Caldilineaceae bacterium]
MYTDDSQMKNYEEYLAKKASEFRAAQADAAWVMMWLGRGVNRVGQWLVRLGQGLKTAAGQQQQVVAQHTLLAQRNSS